MVDIAANIEIIALNLETASLIAANILDFAANYLILIAIIALNPGS